MTSLSRRASRAFTLVELLVVIAIMAIMAAVAVPALKGLNAAGQFNKSIRQITATIDQARSYAVAQNTYVWVMIYSYAGTTSTLPSVYLAAYASNDGTDPVGVGTTQGIDTDLAQGYPDSKGTTFSPIFRWQSFASLYFSMPTAASPSSGASPASPFVQPATGSPHYTLQASNQIIPTLQAVIEFLPSGGVQVNAAPDTTALVPATALVFQPVLGSAGGNPVYDTRNIATIWINGLTGLTTVYRK